jgi:quinolinate synthase
LENYLVLPDRTMDERIREAKDTLGANVVVLGHHYQRDEVIQFADFRGDSLKLSQEAARAQGRYIVFCGVHFMAESADVLSRPGQMTILPDLNAGCSMADMAEITQVEDCW